MDRNNYLKAKSDEIDVEEYVYNLLINGTSILEICDIYLIKSQNVEQKVLNYIMRQPNDIAQSCFEKLQEIKGLPRLDKIKLFLRSKLSESDFIKVNRIEKSTWINYINLYKNCNWIYDELEKKRNKMVLLCACYNGKKISKKSSVSLGGKVSRKGPIY